MAIVVDLTEEQVESMRRKKCPDCGREIIQIGRERCSINFLCCNCGARFNVSDMDLRHTVKYWVEAYGEEYERGYIRQRLKPLPKRAIKALKKAIARKKMQ